jgi:AcrR family transcriptional regulator
MMKREPEVKKRQLLEAALAEFAASGLAGSRIDQIARRAGCSAGLVYNYFGSKEDLFDAVFDFIVEQTVTTIPFTPEDLPGYAGKLFDANEQNPDVTRYLAWRELERGGSKKLMLSANSASQHKIDSIRAAQAAGTLSSHFDAAQLLLLVQSIARMWVLQPAEITGLVAAATDRERRHATVVEAVRQLITAPNGIERD